MVPVKYCFVLVAAFAIALLPENHTSYRGEVDEDAMQIEHEYIPVDTQPPVTTVTELHIVSAEPDGLELSLEPEKRLILTVESAVPYVVPIPGIFLNLPQPT